MYAGYRWAAPAETPSGRLPVGGVASWADVAVEQRVHEPRVVARAARHHCDDALHDGRVGVLVCAYQYQPSSGLSTALLVDVVKEQSTTRQQET